MQEKNFRYLKAQNSFVRRAGITSDYVSVDVTDGHKIVLYLGIRHNAIQEFLSAFSPFRAAPHARTIVLYCGSQLKNPETPEAEVPESSWSIREADDVIQAANSFRSFFEQYAESWFRYFSDIGRAYVKLVNKFSNSDTTHTTTESYEVVLAFSFLENDRELCEKVVIAMQDIVATPERIEFYESLSKAYPKFFPKECPFTIQNS